MVEITRKSLNEITDVNRFLDGLTPMSLLFKANVVAKIDFVIRAIDTNGNFEGACEYLRTSLVQHKYLIGNSRHETTIQESTYEATVLELAFIAIDEAYNHSAFFNAPTAADNESIRGRLLTSRANILANHLDHLRVKPAAEIDQAPVKPAGPKYKRFANLSDMTAFAVEIAKNETENKIWCEAGIYTDNNGLSFRPQVSLISADENQTILYVLRWNAFSDQMETDFIGKRMRIEARDSADWFVNWIQSAITAEYNKPEREQAERALNKSSNALGLDIPAGRSVELFPGCSVMVLGDPSDVPAMAEMIDQAFSGEIDQDQDQARAPDTYICTWNELTEREKSEANSRGFSRERGTKYEVKKRYGDNELTLVRYIQPRKI